MPVADELVIAPPAGEALEPGFEARTRDRLLRFCRANPRIPLFALAMLFLLTACLLAPVIAPFNPRATNTALRLAGPSASHLMGTDQLGRDTFSRVLYGGRTAIPLGLMAVALGAF